jgi:hypothetical protein
VFGAGTGLSGGGVMRSSVNERKVKTVGSAALNRKHLTYLYANSYMLYSLTTVP